MTGRVARGVADGRVVRSVKGEMLSAVWCGLLLVVDWENVEARDGNGASLSASFAKNGWSIHTCSGPRKARSSSILAWTSLRPGCGPFGGDDVGCKAPADSVEGQGLAKSDGVSYPAPYDTVPTAVRAGVMASHDVHAVHCGCTAGTQRRRDTRSIAWPIIHRVSVFGAGTGRAWFLFSCGG